MAQTLSTKERIAIAIKTQTFREFFKGEHTHHSLTKGHVLNFIGKEGSFVCSMMIADFLRENGPNAKLEELLETEKGRILACYKHLPTDQQWLRQEFVGVTVVEPSETATSDNTELIAKLEAFKKTTTYSQLARIGQDKWKARCKALSTEERDVDIATIGPPVDDGFTLKYSSKKSSETY